MDLREAKLRVATVEDAAAIRAIYEPYVLETCITFETEVPSVEDFERRIANTLKNHPYFVAELDGQVIGYCYGSFFRPRVAYRPSMETSIYLRKDLRGGGVGRRLYRALGQVARLQNIYNSYACIAQTEPPTELTPAASRLFHEKVGYHLSGTFYKCGYKLGNWVDMVWMEKELIEHPDDPQPFIPFEQVDRAVVQEIIDRL